MPRALGLLPRLRTVLSTGAVNVLVAFGGLSALPLHAAEQQPPADDALASVVVRSRLELCFIAPVDDAVREQIEQLLSARLDAQSWALSSCIEDSVSAGLSRLHSVEVDLAVLLDAQGDVWRMHVIEPRTGRRALREIGGASRDAAASEAVVSILLSAVEALPKREPTTPAAAVATAERDPREAATAPSPQADAREPETRPTSLVEHNGVPARSAASRRVAGSSPLWGVGIGVTGGALGNVKQWSFGPQLTAHVFLGDGAWTSELQVHGAWHLPRTISADEGTFDWSRSQVGATFGPRWAFTQRANLGLDAGVQWERTSRSHEVAAAGVKSLTGQPHHRAGLQLNLIGTVFVTERLGLRVGGGAQGWSGQTRYVTADGELLLALGRLSGGAWFSLLWRIS